jgi:hypothetical protein
MVLEIFVGDVVRLRKPHPCGSTDWTVTRIGADIGLKCLGCGRVVMLPRRTVERRLKSFVSRGSDKSDDQRLDRLDQPGS